MACVAVGSLVETCNGLVHDDTVWLTAVESLSPNDWVMDPVVGLPRRVAAVHVQYTSGIWPLCHYMGLRADPTQVIQQNGGAWTRVSSTPVTQLCNALYGIVLEGGGGAARVDGVVCRTHTAHVPCPRFEHIRLRFSGSMVSVEATFPSQKLVLHEWA